MSATGPRQIVIRPNASLSVRQARMVFGVMCTVSFGIAALFAARGLWLIFPFAGLEMLCLGAALYVALRDNSYREVITLEGDRIRIESGRARIEQRCEFPAYWAQVQFTPPRTPADHSTLVLRCAGEQREIGRMLSDAERASLAARLRSWLSLARTPQPNP